jgi:hypothetical protein
MKKSKTYLFLVSSFAVIALGLVYLFYAVFLDGTVARPIVSFETTQFQTTQLTYHAGDVVNVCISFCKYRKITARIQYSLVDTYLKTYPEKVGGVLEIGCFDNVIFAIEQIPLDTIPGRYHFSGKNIYRANGLRDVEIDISTNEFEVVE